MSREKQKLTINDLGNRCVLCGGVVIGKECTRCGADQEEYGIDCDEEEEPARKEERP